MFGILLTSHGEMAKGMLNSCKLFFGNDLKKCEAVCLEANENIIDFDIKLEKALKILDEYNEGVVVCCDLYGGTPSNRMLEFLYKKRHIRVLTGMNLGLVMELLTIRESVNSIEEISMKEILDTCKNGISDLNLMLQSEEILNQDNEFFY